ncbi:MAG: hypothetical protein R3C52_12370 [Hyphomonadaceae bacterium]
MSLPDAARYAMDAAHAIGAAFEDLDNGGGYLFRIARGERSVLSGAYGVCTYPVNGATPYTIARDKSHAKSVLRAAGLPVIHGGLFFAHKRRVQMRGPGREVEDAAAFAAQLGYPVFCKPNAGGRGNLAELVPDEAALFDYAERAARDFESFLVEEVVTGDEHRVVVQDGEGVFWSAKLPAILEGDGASTLEQLLGRHNAALDGSGVSPVALNVLDAAGLDRGATPARGERIALPGRRNLSAAGGVETISETVPPPLLALARAATQAIGLRVSAVDIFDRSPERDLSDLVIIEVNGNPGLRTLETAGRMDIIRALWTRMLTELLEA